VGKEAREKGLTSKEMSYMLPTLGHVARVLTPEALDICGPELLLPDSLQELDRESTRCTRCRTAPDPL
jgi:hypothetical protein